MKLLIPRGSKSLSLSLGDGKTYKVENASVSVPEDVDKTVLLHLFDMGWRVGDNAADQAARKAGVDPVKLSEEQAAQAKADAEAKALKEKEAADKKGK
jgi:hypothetical protein